MTNAPLISVIVPVYNVKKYISRCIDSILAQTYTNLEILLVDDGSTDGSGQICDEYATKDKRIRVFHKPNGGLSDARNYGIEHVKGEFVTFVDSDDWLLSSAIKLWYETLVANKADVCIARLRHYVDGEISPYTPLPPLPADYSRYTLRVFLLRSACGKLYREDFLRFHQLRFAKGLKFEDSLFWYKLLLCKPILFAFQGEGQYIYRQRSGSIIHTHDYRDISHEYYDMLKVIRQLQATQAFNEYLPTIVLKSVQFFILSDPQYRRRFFLKMKAIFRKFPFYLPSPSRGKGVNVVCKGLFNLWKKAHYDVFWVAVSPLFILKIKPIYYYLKRRYKD